MTKRMLVICRDCGKEERISVYSREEADRQQIRLVRPRCSGCGSPNVMLSD